MPLSRLCFILPADADEIQPPPTPLNPYKRMSVSRRVTALLRRSLHWFCRRRWHGFCRCFPDEEYGSSRFEDIHGINHSLNEHVGRSNPRIFSYAELYIGTSGFSPKELLGSGGFGRVYRAVLPSDGTVVAVKRVSDHGDRFEKAIAAELAAVAQLRHRNLVSLRGWCVHDHQLLLVYDYMPNGSLDRLLFAPSGAKPALDWDHRWRIITGLAASLFYLHEQLDTQIIHRDVKASNVMLDSKLNAKLGDFGLARWLEHNETPAATPPSSMRSMNNYQFRLSETSRIGGTIGYLPPETFQKGGGATAKHDVFSFGVVVLEVATGRKAVDLTYPDEEIFMLDWVRRLSDEGKLLNAGDQRSFDGPNPLSQRLLRLGLHCTLHDPQFRPTMKWVIDKLTSGDLSGELPALPLFHTQPLYISLSPIITTTNTAHVSSNYVTPPGSTVFFTADSGDCGGSGSDDASGSNSRCRYVSSIPKFDTPREIPFKEIITITNNFSKSQMVAELDFGTGYHGYLDKCIHVLVKRLGMKSCPALRVRFSNELHNLGRLRHRHLVKLRGWCTEQGEMLVVYDYSSRSQLSRHIFSRTGPVLSWRHRYNVVKSLASAILYLHEEWEEQVIHRNITSSAVLLDTANDMNPRLGSFALAEFLSRNDHDGHHVAKQKQSPRGIFGYMAPEYMENGEATTMADVYSFGVVVLEVVSGVMAVDFRCPEVLLVRRVWGLESRRRGLEEIADPRLDGKYNITEMVRLIRLGMACTRSNPGLRPSMKQIVSILDGSDEVLEKMVCKKEGREEMEKRNAVAMSLVRRIQAIGIN